MERKNNIGISFDSSYFSQIFIHTAGAYLEKPISKNNNKYLANLRNIPPDERFGELILELEKTTSETKKEKIINEMKSIVEIDETVNTIPLTFKDNVEELKGYIVFEPLTAVEHNDLSLLDFISYDFNVFNAVTGPLVFILLLYNPNDVTVFGYVIPAEVAFEPSPSPVWYPVTAWFSSFISVRPAL